MIHISVFFPNIIYTRTRQTPASYLHIICFTAPTGNKRSNTHIYMSKKTHKNAYQKLPNIRSYDSVSLKLYKRNLIRVPPCSHLNSISLPTSLSLSQNSPMSIILLLPQSHRSHCGLAGSIKYSIVHTQSPMHSHQS